MKIKTSFATNSSSSSFVVAWPTKIRKLEDVQSYISNKEKANQVLNDSRSQKAKLIEPGNKKVIEKISKEFSYGYLEELERFFRKEIGGHIGGFEEFKVDFAKRHKVTEDEISKTQELSRLAWEDYNIGRKKLCNGLAKEFCEQNEGNYLYIFKYGDEDGQFFEEMEHGGTFNNLPHIRINKH